MEVRYFREQFKDTQVNIPVHHSLELLFNFLNLNLPGTIRTLQKEQFIAETCSCHVMIAIVDILYWNKKKTAKVVTKFDKDADFHPKNEKQP